MAKICGKGGTVTFGGNPLDLGYAAMREQDRWFARSLALELEAKKLAMPSGIEEVRLSLPPELADSCVAFALAGNAFFLGMARVCQERNRAL